MLVEFGPTDWGKRTRGGGKKHRARKIPVPKKGGGWGAKKDAAERGYLLKNTGVQRRQK